jgi:hypothetical protein
VGSRFTHPTTDFDESPRCRKGQSRVTFGESDLERHLIGQVSSRVGESRGTVDLHAEPRIAVHRAPRCCAPFPFGESDLERHLIGLDLPVVDLPTRLYDLEPAQIAVYKVTELVGSSTISIEDAIQSAVGRASATLRNLRESAVPERSIKSDFW